MLEVVRSLVITTDSEYVVAGLAEWVKAWSSNDWRTSGNRPVKNRDLWKAIFGEVERLHQLGTAVKLWKIPREENTVADAAAKAAANLPCPRKFTDIGGMMDPQKPLADPKRPPVI